MCKIYIEFDVKVKNKIIILSITQMIFHSYISSIYLDRKAETLEVEAHQALLYSSAVFVPPYSVFLILCHLATN